MTDADEAPASDQHADTRRRRPPLADRPAPFARAGEIVTVLLRE